ncbi:MAG: protein kinase, partial [bacterium]
MKDDKNLPELDIEAVDDQGVSGSLSNSGPGTNRRAKAAEDDPMLGVTLKNTYRLVKKIGEGGMGNVYKALQSPLQREVAVKLLKPTENNPEGEHYFMREVQAINMLRHPNIIGILDFGKEADGTLYLVMEYLPGRTLKRCIKREYPLDPVRLCNICAQVLSALEQAHQ